MKAVLAFGAVAALAIHTTTVSAGDLESGLKIGSSVAAFQVVKQGGIDDGVEVGKKLCYR